MKVKELLDVMNERNISLRIYQEDWSLSDKDFIYTTLVQGIYEEIRYSEELRICHELEIYFFWIDLHENHLRLNIDIKKE